MKLMQEGYIAMQMPLGIVIVYVRTPLEAGREKSFDEHNHQDQNQDQDSDGQPRPVVLGLATDVVQPTPRPAERVRMAVHAVLDVVQHSIVRCKLMAHLNTQVALSTDTRPEKSDLLVLVRHGLLVLLVNLDV